MAVSETFGKLVIIGKDGGADMEFPLDKKSILIGRDHSCDIRIVNKEISRKHAELYVEDSGAVFISSMGREPVSVNGHPVLSPQELVTGDKIEVLLENRTRVFYFHGDDETVQIRALSRPPLADANAVAHLAPAVAAKDPAAKEPAGKEDGRNSRGPAAPPPPPPPPPAPGMLRPAAKAPPAAAPPPPPPPPAKPSAAPAGMPAALQDAIKAGVQLKKVQPKQPDGKAAPSPAAPAGGMFVPNAADLLKLRAGLRKTAPAGSPAADEAPVQPADDEAAPQPAAAEEEQAGSKAAAGSLDMPAEKMLETSEQPEPAAASRAEAAEPMQMDEAAEQRSDGAARAQAEAAGDVASAEQPAAEPVAEAAAAEPGTDVAAVAAEEAAAEEPEAAPGAAVQDVAAPAAVEEAGAEELKADCPAEEAAPAEPASASAEEPAAAAPEAPAGDVAMEEAAEPEAGPQPAEHASAAESAAAGAAAAEPNSALKKRKSVRFHVEQQQQRFAGTPEGAARDATITIRLRKGDIEQIINVDDNTVAFAQWGLGTMGAGEQLEELPDTVVSKRSRPSSAAPPSAGKTPVPSALKELLRGSPMASVGAAQPTPGAVGPQAPAPTPATGIRPAAGEPLGLVMDPTTLANKLAEMAEQHDVTLEVPADFFKSPAPPKDGLQVVLTPKSKGKTPVAASVGAAVAQEAAMASIAKSVPRSTGRSRLAQAGPAAQASSGAAPAVDAEEDGLEKTQEIQVPAEVLAAAQASAKKQSVSRRRSLSRTPGTKIVIIEQATQTTPRVPANSAAKQQASEAQAGNQASPRMLSTIAVQTEAQDCGDDVEQERSDEGGSVDGSLDEEAAAVPAGEMVPLKQYQKAVVKAKAYHAEARQLAAQLRRMTAKATKLKKAAAALSDALDKERAKRQELQDAMQQVVLNRAATELEQEQQQEDAADEAEQQDAAAAEAQEEEADMQDAEQEEEQVESDEEDEAEQQAVAAWVPRVVVLGQLSKGVSTAERAGQVVIVRPSHLATAAAPAPAAAPVAAVPEVVVLPTSARKTPGPSARKMPAPSARKTGARSVAKQARTPAPSAAKGATPAPAAAQGKTPAPSAVKSGAPALPKSMLKEAPGTGTKLVLDNVELPGWLFDGEQQAPEVMEAAAVAAEEEAPVVAAAAEAQAQTVEAAAEEKVAMEVAPIDVAAVAEAAESEGELEQEVAATMEVDAPPQQAEQPAQEQPAAVAEEAASEEDEEEAEDFCHICGQSDEGDILLLCDSCDNACHLSCCNPPLKRVPKGDWFCVECTAKQQAEAAAAAAAVAAKAKPAAKRSGKRQAAEEPAPAEPAQAEEQTKPARGKRGAAAAAAAAPAETAAEEAPAKAGRGRGSKRAAAEEAPVAAASEEPSGRSKRSRAAAPKPSEEPAPSGRTRGKAATSTATKAAEEAHAEVSTRRSRAAAAPKTEAGPVRSTRSRR